MCMGIKENSCYFQATCLHSGVCYLYRKKIWNSNKNDVHNSLELELKFLIFPRGGGGFIKNMISLCHFFKQQSDIYRWENLYFFPKGGRWPWFLTSVRFASRVKHKSQSVGGMEKRFRCRKRGWNLTNLINNWQWSFAYAILHSAEM